MNFRQIINGALERQNRSVYWLGKLESTPTSATIYRYLNGDRDLTSERLATLLEALGVGVTLPKKKKRK